MHGAGEKVELSEEFIQADYSESLEKREDLNIFVDISFHYQISIYIFINI